MEAASGFKPRLIVEAVVLRACPNCGCKCQDAGATHCEGCGCHRPANEDLGVIYDNKETARVKTGIIARFLGWIKGE